MENLADLGDLADLAVLADKCPTMVFANLTTLYFKDCIINSDIKVHSFQLFLPLAQISGDMFCESDPFYPEWNVQHRIRSIVYSVLQSEKYQTSEIYGPETAKTSQNPAKFGTAMYIAIQRHMYIMFLYGVQFMSFVMLQPTLVLLYTVYAFIHHNQCGDWQHCSPFHPTQGTGNSPNLIMPGAVSSVLHYILYNISITHLHNTYYVVVLAG